MDTNDVGIEDIQRELAQQERIADRMSDLDRIASAHGSGIDAFLASRGKRRSANAGSLLAQKLTDSSRARYRSLIFFESQIDGSNLGGELDRSMLVMCGCQILEDQLRSQLVPVAHAAGADLASVFDADDRAAGVLRAWHDGQVPVTIGVLHVILMALRRALAARQDAQSWLQGLFEPAFGTLLGGKGLEKSLGRIRNEFRNPLAHATASVDAGSYGAFCALLVGAQSMSSWDIRGATPSPPAAHLGVLHHHLACAVA